jgi:hypothetical protein
MQGSGCQLQLRPYDSHVRNIPEALESNSNLRTHDHRELTIGCRGCGWQRARSVRQSRWRRPFGRWRCPFGQSEHLAARLELPHHHRGHVGEAQPCVEHPSILRDCMTKCMVKSTHHNACIQTDYPIAVPPRASPPMLKPPSDTHLLQLKPSIELDSKI